MNKTLLKDSLKEIKKSYKRFISILIMAMLGVGFFVGIKGTAPNMRHTIDAYFDEQNVFDIKVMSTLGLTDDDINSLKDINGVLDVYGVYDKDVIFEINDAEYILNAMEYSQDINKLELLEGNYPQNEDECVVEENFINNLNLKVGDKIDIKESLGEDEETAYKTDELKIVGVVNSPLYISVDRGSSKLGSGKIDYYIYLSENNINTDIYTGIYVTADGAKELNINDKKYDDLIKEVKDNIKNISNEREQARYDNLINEAETKINDAEQELNEEKVKAEAEIADAERKLQDAQNEIAKGEKEISSNTSKANTEFANAEKTLKEKEKEYENGKIEAEKRNKTNANTDL